MVDASRLVVVTPGIVLFNSVLLALFLRDFFELLRFFELAEELRRHEGVGELLLGVGDDALHKVVEVNPVLGVLTALTVEAADLVTSVDFQQSSLFVFSIDGPKQNAGSLLTPVSNIVFMVFHMVPSVLLSMAASVTTSDWLLENLHQSDNG